MEQIGALDIQSLIDRIMSTAGWALPVALAFVAINFGEEIIMALGRVFGVGGRQINPEAGMVRHLSSSTYSGGRWSYRYTYTPKDADDLVIAELDD